MERSFAEEVKQLALGEGQVLFWSEQVYAEDEAARDLGEIIGVQVRAQTAQHGGGTRRAVEEDEG